MLRLTKIYRFSASHRLHVDAWSDERNRETFGKCNYPYGHGHNYTLELSVEGAADPASGLCFDRAELDRLANDAVLSKISHVNMNLLPEFSDKTASTENLAVVIAGWLQEGWNTLFPDARARLSRVRIVETPRNFFELAFDDKD